MVLEGEPTWIKGDGHYEPEEELLPDPRYSGHEGLLQAVKAASKRTAVRAAKDSLLAGNRVNQCSRSGWTALHEAVERGWYDLAAFLIREHADVNFPDQYGITPLHVAAVSEQPRAVHIIMALLRANADPNAQDWYKRTPLHLAASFSSLTMIVILLCSGGDPTARDKTNRSVLGAVPSQAKDCERLLYRWGLLHNWPITMGEYDLVNRKVTITHVFPNNDRLVCVSTAAGLSSAFDGRNGGRDSRSKKTNANMLVGDYIMEAKNLPPMEQVFLLLSVFVSFGDFASDLVVVYSFYDEGKTFLLLSSALFILMVAMYTVVLLWTNGRRGSALLQICQLAPVVDAYHLIRTGRVPNVQVMIGHNSPMVGLFSVHRLKLMEALFESIPQAVLQMAVGLASGFTTVLLLSVGMSWFSLVTSLVLSDRREVKYHALASQKRAVTLPWRSVEALAIVLFRLVDAACRIFVYAEITAHHTSYAGYAFVADILLHWFAWTGTEGFREKFAAHNVLNGLASAVYSSVAFAGCDLTRPTWSTPFRTGPWAPSEHMLLGIRCLETVVFGVVLVFAPLQGSPNEVFADRYGWLALALGLGLLVLSILLSMFYVWRCGLIPSQPYYRRGRRRRWASLVAVRDGDVFVGFAQDQRGRRTSVVYENHADMDKILASHKHHSTDRGLLPGDMNMQYNPMVSKNMFANNAADGNKTDATGGARQERPRRQSSPSFAANPQAWQLERGGGQRRTEAPPGRCCPRSTSSCCSSNSVGNDGAVLHSEAFSM